MGGVAPGHEGMGTSDEVAEKNEERERDSRKSWIPPWVAVRSSSQYPSYRFYERHLRGFDPCDGPMCIEPTCASDSAV